MGSRLHIKSFIGGGMNAHIARICTSFIDVPGKTAIAIYFAGCSIRCSGCQNKELWNAENGTVMALDSVVLKIQEHPLAGAVVFLGGEPTDQLDFLSALCARIAPQNKELVLYTGREFEALPKDFIDYMDTIVCGPYRSDLHVGGWPASKNQRIFKKEIGVWKC